jgi:starch synthase
MKILMVASEARPFAMTGGLADVLGALPAALRELGHDVAVLIPRYRRIPLDGARRIYDHLPVWLGASSYTCAVYQQRGGQGSEHVGKASRHREGTRFGRYHQDLHDNL